MRGGGSPWSPGIVRTGLTWIPPASVERGIVSAYSRSRRRARLKEANVMQLAAVKPSQLPKSRRRNGRQDMSISRSPEDVTLGCTASSASHHVRCRQPAPDGNDNGSSCADPSGVRSQRSECTC